MSDQDFLKLLSAVVRIAKPFHNEAPDITDIDLKFNTTNIDSLDTLMITVYMFELFGVDEENIKILKATTPKELKVFLEEHKTKDIADVDQAIAGLK